MKEKNNKNINDPTEKYENSNFIARKLIKNYFGSIKLISPKNINTILEVGCGPGHTISHLLEIFEGKKIEASDIDPNFVLITQKKYKSIPVVEESVYSLNREDKSFDLILALEVLEHLEKPKDALKEMHRITKRYVIISVPREPIWRILNMARGKYLNKFGNTIGHINHWNIKKFKKMIDPDFKIVNIETPLPWMIFLLEKK